MLQVGSLGIESNLLQRRGVFIGPRIWLDWACDWGWNVVTYANVICAYRG